MDREGRAGVGAGGPRTVEVTRRRFEEVDEGFAHDEGEGDRSLAGGRAHTDYFTQRGEFAPGMEVYCERFRLVEAIDAR